MHVIVVGCGRVGSGLATGLVETGHSVTVIDRNAKAFRRLPNEWSGTAVVGSGFDRNDLDRAGAGKAQALAAVTSGDNSNILTARIARETYDIPHVVARIYDPRRAQIYLRLGIPTVATVSWTIEQVRRRLLPDEIDVEWSDPTGGLTLVERPLPAAWAGRPLRLLEAAGRISLVSVTRAGRVHLSPDDLVGQEGDLLHLATATEALGELHLRLGDTDGAHTAGEPAIAGAAARRGVRGRRSGG